MKTNTLENRFLQYHHDNPEIYELCVRFARQAMAAGHERYSMRIILERIRWHLEVETNANDFLINNNHTPFYSRLIMQQEPDLKGFFVTRACTHE